MTNSHPAWFLAFHEAIQEISAYTPSVFGARQEMREACFEAHAAALVHWPDSAHACLVARRDPQAVVDTMTDLFFCAAEARLRALHREHGSSLEEPLTTSMLKAERYAFRRRMTDALAAHLGLAG